jgi:hypothetical protein
MTGRRCDGHDVDDLGRDIHIDGLQDPGQLSPVAAVCDVGYSIERGLKDLADAIREAGAKP